MKIDRFEELEVWQLARRLVNEIYTICNSEKFCKDFSLKNQITRSSISIMSNIAEGFERKSNKEFIQYLFIAKGSAGEVRSQLYIARDLNYIGDEISEKLLNEIETISRSLSGFIKYLNKS